MNPILAQREIALGGVALLSVLVSLAIGAPGGGSKESTLPQPVGNRSSWYRALAAPGGAVGRRSACGIVVRKTTLGVAHPVLPCGAKIILRSGNKQVLTEVIDNTLVEPGRQLEVTEALARKLGIDGTVELQWRFATASGS